MSISAKSFQSKIIYLSILIGALIYSNTLNVPFYLDDEYNIQNPALLMDSFSADNLLEAGLKGTLKSRPISNISFAVNYLFDGFNVAGYHIFNIIIHISGTIFLFWLLQITLALPGNRDKYCKFPLLAFYTALIWLVHPLATQSVTYIVQRMNSMAAMFFVLSLLFYVKGRLIQIEGSKEQKNISHRLWFSGSIISGFFAIGSKEIAATLPLIILLYEWFFFQDLRLSWLKKKIYWISSTLIVLGTLAFFYTKGHPIQRIFNGCGGRDFTTWERVLTQFRVVVHYMGLILYPNPSRLTFDYNLPFSTSLLEPVTTLISLGVLIGLVILAIFLARRERLLSFCIIWFLINLVIESSVICLELVFEHRTYLPSMFFILFFTALFFRIAKNNILISIILISTITLFGFWTYERNKVWQDPVTFWLDSVQKSPGKARPHNNLGKRYGETGHFQDAIREFQTAIKSEPDYSEAYYNLGVIYLKQGSYEEAIQQFNTDIQFRPGHALAYSNIGVIYSRQGKIEEATIAYKTAINLSPNSVEALANLGILYAKQGIFDEAIDLLRRALKLKPYSAELHYNLGNVYMNQGSYEEAVRELQISLTLKPDYVKAKKLLNTLSKKTTALPSATP